MHLCLLDAAGNTLVDRSLPTSPDAFLQGIETFQDDLIVGAECMFAWYWLADCCAQHDIPFVIGHALYMKAIHTAKTKNDRIDAAKIARPLRDAACSGRFAHAWICR